MNTIKSPFGVTIEVDNALHNTYKITVQKNARVVSGGDGELYVESDIEEYRAAGFALHIFGGGGGTIFAGGNK